jgi:hypothetical protein
MTYQKRQSTVLEKAKARLRGLQSVQVRMDLGNELTLQSYADLIEASDTKLTSHNLALAEADRTRIEFTEAEASITVMSSRVLSAVAAMYGKDSKEYEMAGGKPLSNYKRAKKRSTATSLRELQNNNELSNPIRSDGTVMNGAKEVTL